MRPLSEVLAKQIEEYEAARRRKSLEKISRLKEDIRREPANPGSYGQIAGLHNELGNVKAAETALRDGIAACPSDASLYWQLIWLLRGCARMEEAIATAAAAGRRAQLGGQFRFAERLILPPIYDSTEELARYRRRFADGLALCATEIAAANAAELAAAFEGLKNWNNFYLPYQGQDDLELQRQYGAIVHHVVGSRFPAWCARVPMPPTGPGGRIRVGYVSHFFYAHTVARLFSGWLANCDRRQFEIRTFYSGDRDDPTTQYVRNASDAFIQIAGDFGALCRQIRHDRLHVLIFLDIGMDPATTMLAALRLAPVQCVAWAHPVTSGLSTIDYFLSSDLMEPEDGQRYYSERLIRLPGIGIHIDRPPIPRPVLTKTRQFWGLTEDALVYLCSQSLFKYQPRFDYILPSIARQVPKAKFVFTGASDLPVDKFRARLRRSFQAKGLNSDDYCLVLPSQGNLNYWNLNLIADFFLDLPGASGSITTLEALACGLPVVTIAGQFFRGRQSYGFLTQIGVHELIGSDEAEFIEIAVRLGLKPDWRKAISARITENAGNLFSDRRSVRALEEFLREVVSRYDLLDDSSVGAAPSL